MGALLGMALGGVLGHQKAKYQQEQQARTKMADLMLQQSFQHPELLQLPETQKMIGSVYGKEAPMMLQQIGGAMQKSQQNFLQETQKAGQPQTPSAGGAPQGQTLQGGTPQSAPPQVGAAQPASGGLPDTSDIDKRIQGLEALRAHPEASNPQNMKLLDGIISELKDERQNRLRGAEFTQRQGQQKEEFQQRQQEMAQSREQRAQQHEESMAATEASRKTTQAIEQERLDLAKRAEQAREDKPATGKSNPAAGGLEARTKAEAQAKTELTTSGIFGRQIVPPGAAIKKRAGEILVSEGLDPNTGQPLAPGTKITDPDGRVRIWQPPGAAPAAAPATGAVAAAK